MTRKLAPPWLSFLLSHVSPILFEFVFEPVSSQSVALTSESSNDDQVRYSLVSEYFPVLHAPFCPNCVLKCLVVFLFRLQTTSPISGPLALSLSLRRLMKVGDHRGRKVGEISVRLSSSRGSRACVTGEGEKTVSSYLPISRKE